MAQDIKIANSKYDIHPLIANRWSPRAYSDKPVSKEQLLKLFDAARWAPSSFNEQPWRFIVGMKGSKSYDKIYDSLGEFNQNWAGKAPVLVIACGKKTFSRNGKENRHFKYDTGAAMTTMAFQATADGLHIHQMAGFDKDVAREHFEIPEDFEPIAACAIGHKGDPDMLDEKNKKSELSERSRKELDEVMFEENWENSFSGIATEVSSES